MSESSRVSAMVWAQRASIILIGWNLMVVLAPPIGFELLRQMAGFSFSSALRGGALVVGALIGMALGIWIAWAMRDFLSRQPFGRVLVILTILLALTYLIFPRSFTYLERQDTPSTQRP